MGKKSEEPVFTKEQESLNKSYLQFTRNAISNLYSLDQNPRTDEIIELSNYLKNNRDIIESPLYDTCKDYYNEGCNSTQVEFLVSLILEGIFGASIGLLISMLIFLPFYGIYALIATLVCLGLGIGYSFYKKYHKKI